VSTYFYVDTILHVTTVKFKMGSPDAYAVQFSADIVQADLTFAQVGNNLEAAIAGSTDKLIVQDWYLGSQNHVEESASTTARC
jgi:hypothetical protein